MDMASDHCSHGNEMMNQNLSSQCWSMPILKVQNMNCIVIQTASLKSGGCLLNENQTYMYTETKLKGDNQVVIAHAMLKNGDDLVVVSQFS